MKSLGQLRPRGVAALQEHDMPNGVNEYMLRWGFEEASGTIQDLYMPFNISTDATISGSAFVFARDMATFDNEH